MAEITHMHVWLIEDPPGTEGICMIPHSHGGMMPLVLSSNNEHLLPLVERDARAIHEATKLPMRLVKFTTMEIVEVLGEMH
jgi:hypothetical protein